MLRKHFVDKLIEPKSADEDSKRREYILNILLLGAIVLSAVATLLVLISLLIQGSVRGQSPIVIPLIVFLVFLSLYFLSRVGFYIISSYLFLGIFYISATHTFYAWGADIPEGLLIYALTIVMSGILINTRFAFFVTFIVSFTLISLTSLQANTIVPPPSLYWRNLPIKIGNTVVFVLIFVILMIVSWLSNREIERSLKRARESESALQKERDNLEKIVEERTRELKKAQREKMLQLYKFAEFGRYTAASLHDLVGPLTALSVETERIKKFIHGARRQAQENETLTVFPIRDEIGQATEILGSKARGAEVEINFTSQSTDSQGSDAVSPETDSIQTYGNPARFNQLVTNLISNAIDAYGPKEERDREKKCQVLIQAERKENTILLMVRDRGMGIPQEYISKIFDPFFSTKNPQQGHGIGLSICKDIIEGDFNGKISVESKDGEGTTFLVEFPIKEAEPESS